MTVTMKDIAARAGVARPLVSLALNGKAGSHLAPETLKRVQELAREMGYKPNRSAQKLRGAPSRTIGVVFHESGLAIWNVLARAISERLQKEKYQVILENTWTLDSSLETIVGEFVSRGVDGAIVMSTTRSVDPAAIPVPIVTIGAGDRDRDIRIDLFRGGYVGTRHLLERGRRNIAFVYTSGLIDNRETQSKVNGYRAALEEAGSAFRAEWVFPLSPLADFWGKLKKEKIDAILSGNDLSALETLSFLARNGVKVPDDIALVGFDGLALARFTNPTLTTVAQPLRRTARYAVDHLLRVLGGDKTPPESGVAFPVVFFGESSGGPGDDRPLPEKHIRHNATTIEELYDIEF